MSIKTKIAALALAALAVTGGIAATSQPAHAGHNNIGLGIAAGVLGAAVVGSAIAAGPGYYGDGYGYGYGYRRCGWVRQFDAWGNYIGKVRTCAY